MVMGGHEPLGVNLIFALDEAAGVLARRNVLERNVAPHGTEERNSFADEHGDTCHDQTLNEACA